ncbi:DUF917 domain-containing protein [Rhodococcus sp. (in: high G+C Gram-positive bacteria)]|uniref:DUF917 domain-containing protein n=1 Tax=Rhodococcus sp. TaxID=1831 RepID=UPI001A224A9C|nr:DUF917 domain-containing protein [Rhodococcus sp. (in: high G+C Gram-positive bacteria)]MBJ7478294.1 DUF917 domain-containing protein [Rhodococcus sp. (in: high G+C Gram-positive bacteria)]
MSWTLRTADLDDLARGAALLGTGGGGDPFVGKMLVAQALGEAGEITILDPEELDDDAWVIPVAQMGAPTVVVEKMPRGTEPELALITLERHSGRTADATMPMECGGINSMIPLLVAARRGLPVVDADGMGRAFPQLEMETFSVYGISASPLAMANEHDEVAIFDTGSDNSRLEGLARGVTSRFGGMAHIAQYSMTGADVKRTAIPRTLSLALTIGRSIRLSREQRVDPVQALVDSLSDTLYGYGRVLFHGKVIDVDRRTDEGFARGSVRIAGVGDEELEVQFQNENLIALHSGVLHSGVLQPGVLVAIVPDLICIVEADTAEPITTEGLRYGQRVAVIGIATPPIMRTPEALAVFGPASFGLDRPFRPVETLEQPVLAE